MPTIRIKYENRLEAQIKRAIRAKMKRVFDNSEKLLLGQAEVLRQKFQNSKEFKDLSGKLVGEFGFTPEEVQKLDRITDLMVPKGNEITITKIKTGPNLFLMQLDWVDFRKLKEHEFAQHALTKLDQSGRVERITDIISWVEWLEEGASVIGYQFFRPGTGVARLEGGGRAAAAQFSRSGEGLMRRTSAGFWTFQPTRVFERIAQEEKADFIKKGFGLLLKKAQI